MRLLRSIVLLGLFGGMRAWGVITIGDTLPAAPAGLPFDHVAQIGGVSGSAVYLGNGFLLTAAHVTPIAPVFLNNATYQLDASYGEHFVPGIDLKVIKIVGDPGLAPIEMVDADDNDLGAPSVLIGWGVGKGTEIPGQGWRWDDDSTARQRWGTNTTSPDDYELLDQHQASLGHFLQTTFDHDAGASEATLTLHDSGSGLFQMHDGVWKLAGIGDSVDHNGKSLYDNLDPETPGEDPDASYYLRLQTYRSAVEELTATPEPGSGLFLLLGGGLLMNRRARRGWAEREKA